VETFQASGETIADLKTDLAIHSEFPLSFDENGIYQPGRIVPFFVHDPQQITEAARVFFANSALIGWKAI
jgi:hypothetical protein